MFVPFNHKGSIYCNKRNFFNKHKLGIEKYKSI